MSEITFHHPTDEYRISITFQSSANETKDITRNNESAKEAGIDLKNKIEELVSSLGKKYNNQFLSLKHINIISKSSDVK